MAIITEQKGILIHYYKPSEIWRAYKSKLTTDYYAHR